MASMRDVAQRAGVSVSTVSRVVNNTAPVDSKTRLRVLDAIESLNFSPNLLAKGLRSRSGFLIGLIVPEIVHYTFASFIDATEETARALGISLIVGNTRGDAAVEEQVITDLISRSVDGIVFSRVSDESRVLNRLTGTSVPFVVIDRSFDSEDIPTVVLNNEAAGSLAASHLISLGHTDIGCVTGPLNISLCRRRLRGFRRTLDLNGISLPEDRVYQGSLQPEAGREAARHFFQEQPGLTAVWAHNDLMALGFMQEARRRGVQVPQSLSVMGMDDTDSGRLVTPTLTSVCQNFAKMCSKAVDMLMVQRRGEPLKTTRVVVEPSLIIRESTSSPG